MPTGGGTGAALEATALCSQDGLSWEPGGARCVMVATGTAPSLPTPEVAQLRVLLVLDSPPPWSSPGSRRWGRVSHSPWVCGKPEACPALLLPGKQSSSRRRALSSMAVLKPREEALLGDAQCVLFKSVCLVSPPASQ